MKPFAKSLWFKIIKICGIVVVSILAILFVLPYLFPGTISKKIKEFANKSITTKLDFSEANLSFFNHFPALTLTIHNVSIMSSAPFEKDTLIAAKQISFGIDLTTIFSDAVKIDQIFLSDADVNVKVNKQGKASYNIYNTSAPATTDTTANTTGLQLESIVLEHCNLQYDDESIPVSIIASNLNYTGKGDLSKSVFDLSTRLSADSFSFVYNGQPYVNKKRLKAKLITKINTNSLALVFEKNRIRINQLPVDFSGRFDFLKSGYNMDFNLASPKATLEEIITAIPPDLAEWLDNTKVKGSSAFHMQLKGEYNKQTNAMPNLEMGVKIRDGFIAYESAPSPLEHFFLNLDVAMPSLNTDSLKIDIDSLYFNLDKGHFSAVSHTIGLDQPYIRSAIDADLDLDKWGKAVGLQQVEIKGTCSIKGKAEGKFLKEQDSTQWRKNIVVTSIPSFNIESTMRNGYFKFVSLPQALHDISFNIKSSCADGNYRHTVLEIDQLNAMAMNNIIKGYAKIVNPDEPHVEADLTTKLHLQDLKQFIPVDKFNLAGDASLDIKVNGVYNPAKKIFPVTKANLNVQNAEVQTAYYPHPIQKLNIITELVNTTGTLSGTDISIKPVSFEFEGQPFLLKAAIKNPDDVQYDIVSDGTIDLGKIYKVFAVAGYDVTGLVKADLSLKGKQSDATAGRYQLLINSGTLDLKEVKVYSNSFPQPFIVHSGAFSFKQDKMWFDAFKASYGSSSFVMNGFLNNVINYLFGKDEKLQGKFTIATDYINVNEFTAYASPADSANTVVDTSSSKGVVLIPTNLSLSLDADIKKVNYDSVMINNFKGQLVIDSGRIKLNQTSFRLVDAGFKMNALYAGINPRKALFNFQVKADSFSIAKAYNEIPMFRQMASSVSGVQGIVGLDYTLEGRLDENMQPVYPSLKGKGALSLKNVKLKGFKLMNAVSSGTDYEQLKDPDLSGIVVKSTINNNIITIERVKLRIAGLRPRFEGQVSMDGLLNLKGRVGLPPLGIFGIPFMVSGTSDHPEVKLKRDKTGKVLQEKEDTQEPEEQ
ncbi:MAG: AsmA-like C-terminal region-containing protein [Agriterribacter sp.]